MENVHSVKVYKNGRISIPKSLRDTFKIEEGSQIIIGTENDKLVIVSHEQQLEELNSFLTELNQNYDLKGMADELIIERRAEVQKEQ